MSVSLTEQTAVEYILNSPLRESFFGGDTTLTSAAITEGNVNLLFRVASANEPSKAVLIKQALPYAWRYPDFKMPVDRQKIEYGILEIEGRYCPAQVPKIYHYDEGNHVLVIEYFSNHLVMREGLMQRNRYPRVAEDLGLFMARTLFYTSDLHLSSAEKKAMVPQYINPVLCKVQEDLVFTQPFIDHPNNRWSKPLTGIVQRIHADDMLRAEIYLLKERYMTHAQALLHNDLHTGSIMLNQAETKIVDPEFGFFGPIGHDVGSYLSNLVLSYAAQEWHSPDEAERASYREWLLDLIRQTWQIFEAEWLRLWEDEGIAEWPSDRFRLAYLRQLLQDTAGFGAAEGFRRVIGMAHVHDFWTIQDEQVRARAESLAINALYGWAMLRKGFTSIEDLIEVVRNARSDL
jgi:5-methylthioribose kinase